MVRSFVGSRQHWTRLLVFFICTWLLVSCGKPGSNGKQEAGPEWSSDARLQAIPVSSSKVRLKWPAPGKRSHLAGYRVSRNGNQVAEVDSNRFRATIADLSPEKTYTFGLRAVDDEGRTSKEPLETRYTYQLPDPSDSSPDPDPTAVSSMHGMHRHLFSGDNPIQRGVEPGTMEPERMSVISGRVIDRDGKPVQGVYVSALRYPEFGHTLTRPDGEFDLAVNGGGAITLEFLRGGYLGIQRTLSVGWAQYEGSETVVLTEFDDKATEIDASDGPVVARASVESDADGKRQATLVFPGGVETEMVLPDGSTEALDNFHVRATEYTRGESGPQAMPGELPSTSAYTYAVELSVDEAREAGAESVEFSKPVALYVENFMGYPTGMEMPLGTYSRQDARWVPEDSGRAVEILGTDSQNRVTIDVDGDGQPADTESLGELGISEAERQRLADVYQPGDKLWRVQTTHFTPHDVNPNENCDESRADCEGPDGDRPWEEGPETEDECEGGSVIDCPSQTLREFIPIAGTGHQLAYSSRFQFGFQPKRTRHFNFFDQSLNGLLQVRADIALGGREFGTGDLTNTSPEGAVVASGDLRWDGNVGLGKEERRARGTVRADVQVSFCYPTVCSGGQFASRQSAGTGGQACRRSACLGVSYPPMPFHAWYVPTGHLGGWTLTGHHTYDPVGNRLYRGDGTVREVDSVRRVVGRVAGLTEDELEDRLKAGKSPNRQFEDGDPADRVFLGAAFGIEVGPDKSTYFAEPTGRRLLRVDAEGGLHVMHEWSADSMPGSKAQPNDVARDRDGTFYIVDAGNQVIWRLGSNGEAIRVAGRLDRTACSDQTFGCLVGQGGPAREAVLSFPDAVDVGPDGSLYVADSFNHRIRRIAPARDPKEREISTVAGSYVPVAPQNARPGFSGDGGPATEAKLDSPTDVAVGPDGTLYIADSGNQRVRVVDNNGQIETIAGGSGSEIDAVNSLAVTDSGVVYIGGDQKIYAVDEGQVRRLVGDDADSNFGLSGHVDSLAVGPGGSVLFPSGSTIRRLEYPTPTTGEDNLRVPSSDGRRVFVFDRDGRHQKTVDAVTGVTLRTFAYDDRGWLSEVIDRYGRKLQIQRDAEGRPKGLVSPDGLKTTLELFEDGDPRAGFVKQVTNPAGESHKLDYRVPSQEDACKSDGTNCEGLLRTLETPRGAVHRFGYDRMGRLISDEGPGGFKKELTRTESQGGETRSVEVSTKEGVTTTYRSDTVPSKPAGALQIRTTEQSDGGSLVRQHFRDGLVRTQSSDGSTFSFDPQADPQFGSLVASTGTLTFETPSGKRRQTRIARSVNQSDNSKPWSISSKKTTWTTGGRTLTQEYRASSESGSVGTITQTSPMGRKGSVILDEQGRAKRFEAPGRHPVRYRYRDSDGRLEEVVVGAQGNGATRRWRYQYDQDGFLEKVVDPTGREVRYQRDTVGRPTEQLLPKTNADGDRSDRTLAYQWDRGGNLTGLTPPGRPQHRIEHDQAGRPTRYAPPTGTGGTNSNVLYRWDADHRLQQLTQPGGDLIDPVYEEGTDRLDRIESPDRYLDFQYDSKTKKLAGVAVEDPASSKVLSRLAFERDGPLLTKSTWHADGTEVASVTRHYDDSFRLKRRAVRGSAGGPNKVDLQYNQDSQPTKIGALGLQYGQKTGLMTSSTVGSTTTRWTYDKFAQPTTVRTTGPSGFTHDNEYTYDKLGRIETHTETLAGQTTAYKYRYDARGRLVEVYEDEDGDGSFGSSELTHHYTWGPNGNRLAVETPDRTLTSSDMVHDDQDRLTRYGPWRFAYDKSGTIQSKTQTNNNQKTRFSYDALGNLTEVGLPDGRTLRYTYDPNGRRVTRRLLDKMGNQTAFVRFVYGDALNPVATLDESGQIRSRFVYGERGHVPSYMVKNGTTYRLVVDHLGSVRAVVDTQTGQVEQQIDYGPFGRVLQDTNPGFQPFGFAGGVYDRASKLVHFSARNYDPLIGRWLKKDGIGFAGGDTNLYGYVSQDPVNFIDPTGHYLETGVDVGFTLYSAYTFYNCPTFWNAAALGLDAGGALIPVVAGAGTGLVHGDEAVEVGSKVINKADAGCFVAGTPVETKTGAKSIEEIEPGDYVWSRDPDTGQEAWRKVTETTIRHDVPVLRLTTEAADGSTDALTTTAEHPFWVNSQGWTAARKLEPGDEVFSAAGGWLRVTSATWLQDTRTVYNLEVDEFHTYFVGKSGAWVHNTCPWLGNQVTRTGSKSTGRLRGYRQSTSEIDGGMQKSIETFEDLTGRKPDIPNPDSKAPTDLYSEPGIEVRFRPNSKSGSSAIEVTDHGEQTWEKIHFPHQ